MISETDKIYYLVIIGDTDNIRYNLMEKKLQQINATKVLDNTFIIASDKCHQLLNAEEVRDYVIGKELGYCLVLVLNYKVSSAWHLTEYNSEYFKNITKEINGK